MDHPSTQRKKLPYWLTLLIGLILSCILMNAITMTYPGGVANSWEALGSPPAGVKAIVDVTVSQIWVETQDGSLFTADIQFPCKDKDCLERGIEWEWKSINDFSDVPTQNFPVARGNDCAKLQDGVVPSNPKGQIVECVYAYELGAEYRSEGYFALMADGNILYWEGGNNAIATELNLIFSTFICPLITAVIISAIYLVIYVIRRDFRKSEAP
jgi:hypothetical protein